MKVIDLFNNGYLCGDRYKYIDADSDKLSVSLYNHLINCITSNCSELDSVGFGEDLIQEIVPSTNSAYVNIIEKALYMLKDNGITVTFNSDCFEDENCFSASGWDNFPTTLRSKDYLNIFERFTSTFIQNELDNFIDDAIDLEDYAVNSVITDIICKRLMFIGLMYKMTNSPEDKCYDLYLMYLKNIASDYDYLKYIENWEDSDFIDFIINNFLDEGVRFDIVTGSHCTVLRYIV